MMSFSLQLLFINMKGSLHVWFNSISFCIAFQIFHQFQPLRGNVHLLMAINELEFSLDSPHLSQITRYLEMIYAFKKEELLFIFYLILCS